MASWGQKCWFFIGFWRFSWKARFLIKMSVQERSETKSGAIMEPKCYQNEPQMNQKSILGSSHPPEGLRNTPGTDLFYFFVHGFWETLGSFKIAANWKKLRKRRFKIHIKQITTPKMIFDQFWLISATEKPATIYNCWCFLLKRQFLWKSCSRASGSLICQVPSIKTSMKNW